MAHMHYKGTGQMHSFRGLLADGGQDKIRIEGATGDIAWRITKFQVFPSEPGQQTTESTVLIWRERQDSVSTSGVVVDFSNNELLGAASFHESHADSLISESIVVFDNALFVRNIYVTNTDTGGAIACNYYIELEEVKVSAAGMAQLAVAAAWRTIV